MTHPQPQMDEPFISSAKIKKYPQVLKRGQKHNKRLS
jgi:hypothetical protein